MDNYSSKYNNFILIGNFNSEPTESTFSDFCQIYSCKNQIKDNICFKNPEKPSCIDLIKTNRPKCFQNSVTLEKVLSDFHKMALTVMKVFYKGQKPAIITYRTIITYIILMKCLWLMFSIGYLKWSLKTTTLSLIFSKLHLMKLFQDRLQ